MYRNVVYDNKRGCCHLFTWDEDGNRILRECTHEPYIYLEDNKGKQTSIYKTKLSKKTFRNNYDRGRFLRDSNIKRVFENLPPAQQFLLDTYWKENESVEFSQFDLKICFFDIETYSPNGMPNPEDPEDAINAITLWDNLSKEYYTIGTKEITKPQDNVTYIACKTEKELLQTFINYISSDYPDILSGWNSEFFDMPYIINRIAKVCGEEAIHELSPLGRVHSRMMRGKFGQEQQRFYIDGISCLDYLEIYRRFCLKLRESYKLDAIAELELGENKIDIGAVNLGTFSDENWDKFIEYNVKDVALMVRLEEKLQYVQLLRMLSYIGLTTLESAMGTLSVVNGTLANRARARGEIISTFQRYADNGKNPGAYVSEPKRGFKKNIVSFDANSLYPNVMISLNTSPETKVGRIEKTAEGNIAVHHVSGKMFELTPAKFGEFIKAEQCAVSKAGILFTQKVKGIIPEFLEHLYAKRVSVQKDLKKVKRKINKLEKESGSEDDLKQLKIDEFRLNAMQMTQKILLNSCYGYMGNKRAPIGDDDIASSVTLTGQAVIKEAGQILKNHLKDEYGVTDEKVLDDSWVYSDTDSCYFSLECIEDQVPLMDRKNISDVFYKAVDKLEASLNENITTWAHKSLRTNDSKFVFKREVIADKGLFLQKKRYVLHILDNEGIKESKFKYTGVEVVRTTMPNAIKPYAKKIIETLITTQSMAKTNKLLNETYEVFKTLAPADFAFVMGVKGYSKYAPDCNEFNTVKGMPIHVKSAYFYNKIIDKLGISNLYEDVSTGDKCRYMYVETPNKYGISTIGFKHDYPKEFAEIFRPDYDKMFEKILFQSIERFYDNVGWKIRKPNENVRVELFDLFNN
tara:strand:+ start:12283 stop:14859 length:2577 start_codon:yes stop_codon:yes gene_type:complete